MSKGNKYYSWVIESLGEVDSTMNEIHRRADKGASPGLIILANSQLIGRGRQGREWSSPKGNLYCSMLIFPPKNKTLPNSVLAFVTGISVAEAIADITSGTIFPKLKWPNDILISGKKVSGVLIEGTSIGCSIIRYCIGIGVNLKSHPEYLKNISTDIYSVTGITVRPLQMLKKIIERMDIWLLRMENEGFTVIRERWLELSIKIGSDIKVNTSEKIQFGAFKGLSREGALLLQTKAGNTIKILSGDVSSMEEK